MLIIVFNEGFPKEVEWHVGEKNLIDHENINNIREIQADGHELEYIKNIFYAPENFFPKGRVVTLYGDIAKIVIANL